MEATHDLTVTVKSNAHSVQKLPRAQASGAKSANPRQRRKNLKDMQPHYL